MNGQETNPMLAGLQSRALVVGAVGLAACAVGYATAPEQFFRSYLTGFLYWTAISLGCIGWTMIHHLTDGNWGFPVRRIWEAGARTTPLMFLFLLPILFVGMESIFPWARPEALDDAIIQSKTKYLNEPFFIARGVAYFAIWTAFGALLSKLSFQQDEADGPEPIAAMLRKISGPGLLIMALTVTFSSVDWAMSIDPHWFSTIFGFLFSASDLLAAMAFTIVMARLLSRTAPLDKLMRVADYHDLGNLLMAFTMLWAYLSFSQFLIIWSGNLQEEAPWYTDRLGEGWIIISIILIVFHFALPFVVLLTRRTKRAPAALVKVAAYMLVMRYVDLYWITQPSLSHGGGVHPHWLDLVVPIGMGGVWLAVFAMQAKDRPLVPQKDRRLKEALEGAGGHH